MKQYLMTLLLSSLPLAATQLDREAVGRDLNGWNEDRIVWFGTDGLSFRGFDPEIRSLESGTIEIVMKIEEVQKRTVAYTANVRLIVSQDGLVRMATVEGNVDGVAFTSGEVTRPAPTTAAAPEEGAVDVTPVNAEAEMRQQLSEALDSALARARSEKSQARQDVAARFFSSKAGESASLTKATEIVVKSLFRRVGW
jgi:hypothetical protein